MRWPRAHQPNRITAYQVFVEDEIRLARNAGIETTLIVSTPGESGGDFVGLTRKLLSKLEADAAIPTDYVVGNYRSAPAPDFRNVIGSEQGEQSVTGVALWIVKNAPRSLVMVPDLGQKNRFERLSSYYIT